MHGDHAEPKGQSAYPAASLSACTTLSHLFSGRSLQLNWIFYAWSLLRTVAIFLCVDIIYSRSTVYYDQHHTEWQGYSHHKHFWTVKTVPISVNVQSHPRLLGYLCCWYMYLCTKALHYSMNRVVLERYLERYQTFTVRTPMLPKNHWA